MTERKDSKPDTELEARLQALVRSDADNVAPETKQRLAAMRSRAVAEMDAREERAFHFGWGTASAAAAATVALAVGLYVFLGNGSMAVMPSVADEPEFAVAQDMELLDELEFLAWLEEEAAGGAG